MSPHEEKVLGIDLSKEWIDACVYPGIETWHVKATEAELQAWIESLPSGIVLAVMEGTGGLEHLPFTLLSRAGIPVSVVNPCQIRRYIEAHGQKVKTDKSDARYIAQFGHHVRPNPKPVSTEEQARFHALVTRRGEMVTMRTSEKNRYGSTRDTMVRTRIASHLKWIEKEIAAIDKEIGNLVAKNEERTNLDSIIRSIPGVGETTSRVIQGVLPEIGTISRKAVSSLSGLAPFTRQSGKWKGKSFIAGGRSAVRSVLYMSALSAVRCNPIIRELYERLTQKGKPFKVVITACMRKLLTIINAMVRDNKMWNPAHFSS